MSSCLAVLKVGNKSNKSNKQVIFLIFYQNKNSLNQKYCFPHYWFDAFSFHIQVCMKTQIIRKTMAFGPKDIFWLCMYVINWYKLVLRVYICKLTEMMHLLVILDRPPQTQFCLDLPLVWSENLFSNTPCLAVNSNLKDKK